MKAKIAVFVICVKAIVYLLIYNLHDRTFNQLFTDVFKGIKGNTEKK